MEGGILVGRIIHLVLHFFDTQAGLTTMLEAPVLFFFPFLFGSTNDVNVSSCSPPPPPYLALAQCVLRHWDSFGLARCSI